MKKHSPIFIVMILALLIAIPAFCAEKAGVTLPNTLKVGNSTLLLNGIALREKFIIDVYVAGLYLPEKSSDAATILKSSTSRVMTMYFVRDVDAKSISAEWLEENAEHVTDALRADFAKMISLMVDIKDTETMSFAYEPDSGTEIVIAGKSVGTIAGKDFADAILSTWIGPKPVHGKEFKAALLGQ